jgi:REG-2-like HAD superfamily hydrolase
MYRLKLLTFDLINTLVKVRVSPAYHYAEVANSLGINISESAIQNVYQSVWQQKKRDHPAFGFHHGISSREWWFDFVTRVFTAAGYRGNTEKLTILCHELCDHLDPRSDVWETLPNVKECLDGFKSMGVTLGVISNSDESLNSTLEMHGLSSYFDFALNSAVTGLEKPDPRLFQHALKTAGDVNPASAGHVGDELIADYFAPRQIGMMSFLLNRQGRWSSEDLKNVDQSCVIHSLLELNQLIAIKNE